MLDVPRIWGNLKVTKTVRAPAMTAAELDEYIKGRPFLKDSGYSVPHAAYGEVHIVQSFDHNSVGISGSVNGPTLMKLTDTVMFLAIRTVIGWDWQIVTTALSFNFLRVPKLGDDIRAEARLMKIGKRTLVSDTNIYAVSQSEPAVHAMGTFAVRPYEKKE